MGTTGRAENIIHLYDGKIPFKIISLENIRYKAQFLSETCSRNIDTIIVRKYPERS